MKYREAYDAGRTVLAAAIQEAETDARLLLEFVCGTDRNTLLAHGDSEVTGEQESAYRELLEKRSRHIPLQYLTGVQDFMGLEFAVNEHVLIPRQDTEILAEEALKNLHDGMQVLDLCTGSGCILISLLNYSNNCEGVGTDISEAALRTAALNAGRLLGGRANIALVQSDLFENVRGMFDMIVSNPPYIKSEAIDTLMPEVRDYEPRQALDGGEDGLLFYRRILKESSRYLRKGGMLLFEIGYDQGEAVSGLMEQAGFLEVRVVRDYGGMDRVVCGTLAHGSEVFYV